MLVHALCLQTNLIHRKKYTISWQVCKNMPNLTENSLTRVSIIHGNFTVPINPYFKLLYNH